MTEYKALTCLEIGHGNTGFVTLIYGGSNASCITLGLIKALNLGKVVKYETNSAKSRDNKSCKFLGKIKLKFSIRNLGFCHQFLVAKHLETGTPAILGLDWLHVAQANLSYEADKANLTLQKDKNYTTCKVIYNVLMCQFNKIRNVYT